MLFNTVARGALEKVRINHILDAKVRSNGEKDVSELL